MNFPFLKKTPSSKMPSTVPATATTPTKQFAQGITTIQDIVAPDAIEVDFSHLKIGQKFVRTMFVVGYPRFVAANWLSPLINFEHSLDVSMFIYPIEGKGVLDDLRRKITEMEAEINSDIQRGKIANIDTQVKLEDARALQEQLAKGAERFYQFGLYLTISADSEEELYHLSKQIQSSLGALLIIAKPASLVMEQAFETTQPLGIDRLNITRNMDTTSLATTFPFTSSELTMNEGIMYGINEHNDSLVIFDRFSLENANMVVFAKSGAGKCITHQSTVIIRRPDGRVVMCQIGKLIDELITQHTATVFSKESEGVINPGIQVLAFDEHLRSTWTPVEVAARKSFNRRRKLYRVETRSGREIMVTPDHQMIVMRNGKMHVVRAEAIQRGESTPIPRVIPIADPPSDYAIEPKTMVHDWPSTLPSRIPVTNSLMYLLGLISSEGCLSQGRLHIANRDPSIQQSIMHALKELGLRPIPTDVKDGCPRSIIARPAIFSKLITALGAGGLAADKRIPPIVFSLDNQRTGTYLRGYFDGDGCVEHHEISAISKSKVLISDISYLLLRFGIIARISKKWKRATNSQKHRGASYWELKISGYDQVHTFVTHIGFDHLQKRKRLDGLLSRFGKKLPDTNVDVIPGVAPLFRRLHRELFTGTRVSPGQNFINIKNGNYNPSRQELHQHITGCRARIADLRAARDKILFLGHLPSVDELIRRGSRPSANRLLWKELGQTWRLMKRKDVQPRLTTVLRVYKTLTGDTITVPDVIQWTQHAYNTTGESLWEIDKNLSPAATNMKRDGLYDDVFHAGRLLLKRYRSHQLRIRHAEHVLAELEQLASSDLFWDPIVKIEKLKHHERYVYDLQVEHGVFLAGDGGMFVHNSYFVKLETLRSLMFDTEVIVIDPEEEYRRMADAVHGTYIEFSFSSPAKINPFDLPHLKQQGEDELSQKLLSLHSLMKIMLGEMNPTQEAILDRALVATYKAKGITPDISSQQNEPPLMEDLYKALIGMEDVNATNLAARLEKFVKGSFRGLFDQRTNVNMNNEFVVFGIKNLEDALRPIAMFMVLDFIWTKIKSELKRRLLVVDEAWYLMRNQDSAIFLYAMAKRARKYYLGLTTITQDVEDFIRSDYGKAIVTNSSIQLLMKQSAAAVDVLQEVFYLSEGEKQLLMSAEVGEGLFFAGANHVAIRAIASPEEHRLITSKPQELLEMQKPKEPMAPKSPSDSTVTPGAPRQQPTTTKITPPASPPLPPSLSSVLREEPHIIPPDKPKQKPQRPPSTIVAQPPPVTKNTPVSSFPASTPPTTFNVTPPTTSLSEQPMPDSPGIRLQTTGTPATGGQAPGLRPEVLRPRGTKIEPSVEFTSIFENPPKGNTGNP